MQPYPSSFAGQGEMAIADAGDLLGHVFLKDLSLDTLDVPFELPPFSPSFESVESFVRLELKVQLELLREELSRKKYSNRKMPKIYHGNDDRPSEKHCTFPLPGSYSSHDSQILEVDKSTLNTIPVRSQWTNYIVLLQKKRAQDMNMESGDGEMENLGLAICTRYRKDGVRFRLGRDMVTLLSSNALPRGTVIYCRALKNSNWLKINLQAMTELRNSAGLLESSSHVAKQLLRGTIDPSDIQKLNDIDKWVVSASSEDNEKRQQCVVDINTAFNKQQQRGLALDALTEKGIVLIQGPPGTGKSHILCKGFIPQAVFRNEKVLVVCNSNVAVDALMLKCASDPLLNGKIIRAGFKESVSDQIVEMGLYAEGNTSGTIDRYGNMSGSNSNTTDAEVQNQIRSTKVLFTTIHFAAKDKGKSAAAAASYWNFDTLILDEAGQIEDSKLFILLARCPTLKKIILVGDPKQLQPYVSESLRQQGHGKSTLERLMDFALDATGNDADAAPYIMLEQQFRMAPPLRALVSKLFYDGRLEDGGDAPHRGPVAQVALTPLLVINVTGSEMKYSKLHQSYENYAEAIVVEEIYDFLMSPLCEGVLPVSVTAEDVCILSPFNRQKDRMRTLICGADEENLDAYSGHVYGRGLFSPSKSQAISGSQGQVEPELQAQLGNIDTVDKFQGSERKVVIISTCVTNQPLRAGDPHFINVACSRAQHLLVVVGNFTYGLATDKNWRLVFSHAKETGNHIDHKVTMLPEGECDIHKDKLLSELKKLVQLDDNCSTPEPKGKKPKTSNY